MAQLIKSDGTILEVEPKKGKYFSLAEMQEYVGGYIEPVYLDNGKIMIVNEEGKLNNLPINYKATELYHNSNDFIVGNVLVIKKNQMN